MASKSLPSNFTLPESGWTVPEIALKSVVLPAPFGPTIAMNWPSATSTETSTRAFNPPWTTVRDSTLSMLHPPLAKVRFDLAWELRDLLMLALFQHAAGVTHD